MNLFNLRRSAPAAAEPKPAPVSAPAASEPTRERLMPSAERAPQVFVRGQGSWLWDHQGHAYGLHPGLRRQQSWPQPKRAGQGLGQPGPGADQPWRGVPQSWLAESGRSPLPEHRQRSSLPPQQRCRGLRGRHQAGAQMGQLHRNGAYHIITASQACHGRSLGRCRLPTRCPAIAASLACQVSARCPSTTSRPCTPPWTRAPWRSCSSRSRAKRG